ncbi:hypothetical protein [Jeotgalibaca caeni]|uniref:hypothetical protein n=1 Tax=Jeotgalibaca caeni TaxID=3028623 RepID=UPI00237EBFD4|nr:hypothetical protein [Jeotgalibaca caeni]MDE1548516.1 hypothetical protein [Jeotgalibaca caeni]
MSQVLALLLDVEEENMACFYLPEEKKEVGFMVSDDLIAEFKAALEEEDSYFVTIDPEMKQVV